MDLRCLNAIAGQDYQAIQGDCVDVLSQLPEGSIDFSVYSPPFGNLFVYSESAADMGNSTDEEFAEHYGYLVREKFRVTKPGRLTAVHCSDLKSVKWRDGAVGMKDFSGQIIAEHERAGWIYHSRRTIWKSPVTEMSRTKHVGLIYTQLIKDSAKSCGGMPDYLLTFVRPGDNAEPIEHDMDEETAARLGRPRKNRPGLHVFSLKQWQEWASPVWWTVDQSNVLNVEAARETKDERHLCPLQLDVIERAIILWSNPGDVVLSPFMGVGSEGVMALKLGRKFFGIELEAKYWRQACKNIDAEDRQGHLFEVCDAGCGT